MLRRGGEVTVRRDPKIPQSDYQYSLDQDDPYPKGLSTESVRYWSDYNRVFYHPRSIVQLNDYELSSSLLPFERYESGGELFTNIERQEDLLDRDLRPWAEECDQMQGIQILAGQDDAWAGFASKYTERLRDEFGKASIWVWGIGEEQGKGQRSKQSVRANNLARTIVEMSAHASIFVPMSIPGGALPEYLRLHKGSEWHVSGLQSAAFETMTIPPRLRPGSQKRGHLVDLAAALNVNGSQRISQLQCKVVDPDTLISLPKPLEEMDARIESAAPHALVEKDESQNTSVNLDIDFLSREDPRARTGPMRSSDHDFGGVECLRGNNVAEPGGVDEDEMAYAKKKRRFAGMPVVERYNP